MLGLVPVMAALALTAGQVELTATVGAETRAGEVPVVLTAPPAATVMAILTPGAQVEYLGPRLTLQAAYGLRMFWRASEGYPITSPLYLHTATLSLTGHPTRRVATKLAASAFEGAADYTFLPVLYGESQSALVVVPQIFSASLTGGAEWRATRLLTPLIGLQAFHNQPIGHAEVLAGEVGGMPVTYNLPHFNSVAATPGLGIRLSPTMEASLATEFEYQYVSDITTLQLSGSTSSMTHALSAYIFVPTVGTRTRLSPGAELELKLGIAFTHLASTIPVQADSATPVTDVLFDGRLISMRRAELRLRAEASVNYYLDPVLGIAAPHGAAAVGTMLRFGHDWSVGLQGAFATTFSAHPLGTLYPDEVSASATIPVRHPLSDNVALEFGGRWADRSPFYDAPTFGFHERQLWLYVLVAATSRPTRDIAENTDATGP